jgi:hypothetical protein
MTIGHDLEHRLDGWMQEDATLPDDLAEVLAKLPETPQRRHRWSFTQADVIWRTRDMFSATRVAAFMAIFTLGVISAVVLPPRTELQDGAIAPAAEAPSMGDMARFSWSGTQSSLDPASFGGTDFEFGVAIEGGVTEFDMVATDERLNGTMALTLNSHYLDGDDVEYPAEVMRGSVVLEAQEGTWEGTFIGIDYPGTRDFEAQYVLTGTGAYDGLTAVVTAHNDDSSGLVFPGGMPDAP